LNDNKYNIFQEDCANWLKEYNGENFHLSFVDPPFNQGKDYRYFNDSQTEKRYWSWIKNIISDIHRKTVDYGAIYFMQREKNTEHVLSILREAGWVFQNLIIWKKKTSAVPCKTRFGKERKQEFLTN